jgi:threonine dehydrogenase-like Zn-dependent dehydrogenase
VRAVTFQAAGDVRLEERPDPELQAADDAVVRVEATGICGSDLHIYHGRVAIEPGFVIGHEYVGTVVAAGDGVTEVSVGDRVLGTYCTACGVCFFCRRGEYHKCDGGRVFGHGAALGSLQGAQAEMVLVPNANLTLRRVPEGMSTDVALFAGDVAGTGYHAICGDAARPEPEPTAPDDAVVRVEATGICGSDLHIYHGRVAIEPGFVIGHEYVGTVVAAGDAVGEVAVGDRVLGAYSTACGGCFHCRRAEYHQCDSGRVFGHGATLGSLQGTQADKALVPKANLTLRKVPDGVSRDVALFAGDVMGTGYHAVQQVRPGDVVAVLGLGPVGLCAVQAARVAGASHVVAIDTVQARLEMAKRFGAQPHGAEAEHCDGCTRLQRVRARRIAADRVVGGPRDVAGE